MKTGVPAVMDAYGTYQEAHARELDQSKLILMMYSGAIRFLGKSLESGLADKAKMYQFAGRAEKVILELMASLNMDAGGEMGEMLMKTYRALFLKLNIARLQDDLGKIAEVRDSLAELETSWKQIFALPEYQDFKRNREQFRTHALRNS